ncbi:hypothetical protein BC835DRAFT_762671 [Cytidiella melzeri]|nr:hypothetical protein BC835DRAFT_762671 [Cytidiella melzeri]
MADADAIAALAQQQTITYVESKREPIAAWNFPLADALSAVSATLLVFDWLLLFSDEVKHVWNSRWSFIKVLYLWTRYSPVADTILGLVAHFSYLTPEQCRTSDAASSILLGIGVYMSELIFIWRTFALWKDSKIVKYSLGGVWLVSRISADPLSIFDSAQTDLYNS